MPPVLCRCACLRRTGHTLLPGVAVYMHFIACMWDQGSGVEALLLCLRRAARTSSGHSWAAGAAPSYVRVLPMLTWP